MLDELKKVVCQANLELVRRGLVLETWGNLSGIDRRSGLVVIKPSGVSYSALRPRHMVVVRLRDGKVVEGSLRPSSDTPTHLELYRVFAGIGAVAHTHSLFATAWAQARKPIPVLGTTHADAFYGPVPCTRPLRPAEIRTEYERNTGRVIVETFAGNGGNGDCTLFSLREKGTVPVPKPKNRYSPHFPQRKMGTVPVFPVPLHMPAVLVAEHGPFVWGATPEETVANAAILEAVARMASETLRIAPGTKPIGRALLEKHFLRKHGPEATYGQK